MTLLDVNILLYAYNADCPEHRAAATWLKELLKKEETIGIPWPTLWAFLRLTTDPRVWPDPLAPEKAFEILRELLALPGVLLISPGPRHTEILERIVMASAATGRLMSDAVLAAIAMENGATLASTDRDFSRFKDLRWVNPLG